MKNNMKIFAAAVALSLAIPSAPAYAQTERILYAGGSASFFDENGDGAITSADSRNFARYEAWVAGYQALRASRTVLAVSDSQTIIPNTPGSSGDTPTQNQLIRFTYTYFYTETPSPANAPPPPFAHSDTKIFIDVNDDLQITIDDFIDGRADAQLDRLDEWRTFTSQSGVERDGLTVTFFRVVSISGGNLQMPKAFNVSRYYVYGDTASSPSASGGGGGGSSGVGIAVGAAAVVGVAAYALSGASDTPETTSFFPVAKYAYNNGLRRYQVGGRFDWQKGDWSAHWTATKTSAAGASFSFGSGMQWQGDIFAAKFNSNGVGKRSDSRFSFSAEKEFGLWSFAPLYRADYAKDETAETWRHSVSLKAVWQADKWTLINSAGFHGDSLAAFGDNASAKILLRREF